MANVLKIKKNSTWDSTSNPSNSDVVYGELAWANGTKRLYIGRQSTSGGAVTATRIGGEVGLANDQIVKLDEACSSGEVAVFGSTGLTGRTVTEFNKNFNLGLSNIKLNKKVFDNNNNHGSQEYKGELKETAKYKFSKFVGWITSEIFLFPFRTL